MTERRMPKPIPFAQPVYVTRPILPELSHYTSILQGIWERGWLTNKGPTHDALERALRDHLRVEHLALTGSGTTALMLAHRALGLAGEVVTTPFTSPATPNSLAWCGITPVFADIDPVSLTLDPEAVERAITPQTTAILAVHLYGMPCAVDELRSIADRHGLRLVYDAAHAFGTELDEVPILQFGNATILSFHATKLFNTAEGGAVVSTDPALIERVNLLKNLGIRGEITVEEPGINGRLNELEAALGLANLELVGQETRARARIAEVYRTGLAGLEGMSCFALPAAVRHAQSYFVIRVDDAACPIDRDGLHEALKEFNVFTRRYFYPLCSEYPFYRNRLSSRPENLRVAGRASREVLCLPLFGALGVESGERICSMIRYVVTGQSAT
jgi:dTDP-4-amino-4,6-dideoxygalactose transaminase